MPLPDPAASLFLARGEANFSFSDIVWLVGVFFFYFHPLLHTLWPRRAERWVWGVVAGKGKGKGRGGCERKFLLLLPGHNSREGEIR